MYIHNIRSIYTMSSNKQHRSYCFTLNNYTSYDVEAIGNLIDMPNSPFRYITFGKEIGEQGTPHLQGYLEVKKPMTIVAIRKHLPFQKAHLESRRGTREEARDYCHKDNDYIELGNWKAGGQGARTDWLKVLEDIENSKTLHEFAQEQPEVAIKYTTGVQRLIEAKRDNDNNERLKKEFESFKPNQWQAKLIDELKEKPDNRSVIWYVDQEGGKGKTYMAKYLKANMNAAYLTNCKSADAAHAYQGESIVVFDYSRSNDGTINYSILEQIKNGMIFSPKYDSRTKVYATPHVVCLANFYPNKSMLSADRWDIRELTEEDTLTYDYDQLDDEVIISPYGEMKPDPVDINDTNSDTDDDSDDEYYRPSDIELAIANLHYLVNNVHRIKKINFILKNETGNTEPSHNTNHLTHVDDYCCTNELPLSEII